MRAIVRRLVGASRRVRPLADQAPRPAAPALHEDTVPLVSGAAAVEDKLRRFLTSARHLRPVSNTQRFPLLTDEAIV
jgi:hypothetical protein